MIDLRIKTFLNLCDSKSYTKTASSLFITQPTVTQHIQYLEKRFDKKLFSYDGKTLALTLDGEVFREFCLSLNANTQSFEKQFLKPLTRGHTIRLGATKTVGEFFLPQIATEFLRQNSNYSLDIEVENTHTLLNMLEKAQISFALIEGFFDKTKYDWQAVKKEEFVCVVSPKDTLLQTADFKELLSRPLFLREEGSGTRDLTLDIIKEHGFSIDSFTSVNQMGSFDLIKPLVLERNGVSFGYKIAFEKEIANKTLVQVTFGEEKKYRDFNIVRLKNQLDTKAFDKFYSFCTG